MTTPLNLEEMKKVDHLDLSEEDSKQVKTLSFKDFKTLFPFQELQLNDMVVLLMCVRQHIENAISQNHVEVIEGHKKHQWLNQKIFDVLKINSIMLVKLAVEAQAKKAEESRKAFSASDKTDIEDTTGERRFHVVPGSEV